MKIFSIESLVNLSDEEIREYDATEVYCICLKYVMLLGKTVKFRNRNTFVFFVDETKVTVYLIDTRAFAYIPISNTFIPDFKHIDIDLKSPFSMIQSIRFARELLVLNEL